MTVKRYTPTQCCEHDGTYVTYSDYQKLVAGADKSLNENLRLKEKIHAHELYIRALEVERKAFEKSTETIHNLASENSALLKFIKDDCFVYKSDIGEPSDANDFKPETLVTKAAIDEIKAQGADMVIERLFLTTDEECTDAVFRDVKLIAANLRAGRKG